MDDPDFAQQVRDYGTEVDEEIPVIQQLREKLRGRKILEEKVITNDNFLCRYLRANNNNVAKTEEMLEFYTSFNKKINVDSLLSSTFPKDFSESFQCFTGAVDYENRPVLQIPNAGTWDIKGCIDSGRGELFDRYMRKVHLMVDKMVLENDADYAVLIADLKDVAYSRFFHKKTIEQTLEFVQLVESHSPGVTGRVILLNAPRIVKFIVATFQKIAALSTEVIVIGANDTSPAEILQQYIPEDQLCPEFGGSFSEYNIV